jgi:hypothetical protein
MEIKSIIFFSILLLSQICKGNYSENDTLNVLAINGLNIRMAKSGQSSKIGNIKYGESVIIKNTFKFAHKDTIERRTGNWIEINYKDKVGFVFDGYLSNLPVPKLVDLEENEPYFRMRNYLSLNFQNLVKPIKIIEPYFDLDGKDGEGFYVSVWTDNLKLKEKGGYEWFEYSFYFEKARFAEIVSLFEIFISQSKGYKAEYKKSIKSYKPSKDLLSKSRKNSEIKVFDFTLTDGIRSKTMTFFGGG